jgi:RimJ/RimL family protein N-acetyltransferase
LRGISPGNEWPTQLGIVTLVAMLSFPEIWPPYAVRITEGDLLLSVVTDDDVPGLIDLALSGIHPPELMPFSFPWTDDDPAELPANNVRYYSRVRAEFTPESFSLQFAVRLNGELVGTQGFRAQDFAVTRTGETGSWLARRFQNRGTGTRMRRVVCAFVFDGLGAVEITSGAFVDNPASLAVSAKVGYRPNGLMRMKRRPGEVMANQQLVVTPDTFVRGEPVEVDGLAELRAFLRLDQPLPLTASVSGVDVEQCGLTGP